jgi:hypothetical protein
LNGSKEIHTEGEEDWNTGGFSLKVAMNMMASDGKFGGIPKVTLE